MGSFPFDVAFSAVAPASCQLFCFCLSYRWPPAGAFNFLPVGARHAVPERASCPSTHRAHPRRETGAIGSDKRISQHLWLVECLSIALRTKQERAIFPFIPP